MNVEGQVVGLAIQAMDEEQAARDGRRQVLAVGEEVAECGLDVGVDLTARVQIHGHVKVEHLGAHGCGGAFEVSRNLVVVLLKGDALRVATSIQLLPQISPSWPSHAPSPNALPTWSKYST